MPELPILRRSACALLALTAVSACNDPKAAARQKVAQEHAGVARQALKDGATVLANAAAELAVRYDPLDPSLQDLRLTAALAQIAEGRPAMTREELAHAAYQAQSMSSRDPANAHVYGTVRAFEAFSRNKYTEAEDMLQEAIGKKPDFAPAHIALGEIYLAHGRRPQALDAFTAAVKLGTRDPRGIANVGRLLVDEGRFEEAIRALQAAADSNSPAVLVMLATAQVATDRPMEAIPVLARAIDLEPRNAQARLKLAEAHLKLGQLDEADRAFIDAAQFGAEPWATRGRGAVQVRRGNHEAALKAFQSVLALAPNDVSTLFLAAESSEATKNPTEAARLYQRFLDAASAMPLEAQRLIVAKDRLARLAPPAKAP